MINRQPVEQMDYAGAGVDAVKPFVKGANNNVPGYGLHAVASVHSTNK